MATENLSDTAFLQRMIRDALTARIGEIQAEEIAAANKRVEERIAGEVDKIALKLLSHYSIEDRRGEILITVRKAL